MILTISGIMLIFLGLVISIVFWIPSICNRDKIKAALGKRYPLVYVVYIANGPILRLLGLMLIIWPRI
jgi:uncharacterized membrane protein